MDIKNTGLNTTGSKIYLLRFDTNERMEIQFMPSITESRNGNISDYAIIGRNDPKYQFINGKDTIRLDLDFYAEDDKCETVYARVGWLKSLIASNGVNGVAPRVGLFVGNMFKNDKYIVESVDADYSNHSKPNNFMPRQANVSITLSGDPSYNRSHKALQRKYVKGRPDGSSPVNLGIGSSERPRSATNLISTQPPAIGDPRQAVNYITNTPPITGTRTVEIYNPNPNSFRAIMLRMVSRFRFDALAAMLAKSNTDATNISNAIRYIPVG